MLRGVVLALNGCLGRQGLLGPPLEACCTVAQRSQLRRLEELCLRFARLGRIPGRVLGRFWPKTLELARNLHELEADTVRLAFEF